jgi:hypothetical protein
LAGDKIFIAAGCTPAKSAVKGHYFDPISLSGSILNNRAIFHSLNSFTFIDAQ